MRLSFLQHTHYWYEVGSGHVESTGYISLLATFLADFLCLISLLSYLRTYPRFDLVWFRLSCDYGWIRSGSVNNTITLL